MKKILLALLLSLSIALILPASDNSSSFVINAYRQTNSGNETERKYFIIFRNIYEAENEGGRLIQNNDEFKLNIDSLAEKPTNKDTGHYTDLFQVSIITNQLFDVSIKITYPAKFSSASGNPNVLDDSSNPAINHRVSRSYYYYDGASQIADLKPATKNSSDTSNLNSVCENIFGDNPSGKSVGGWVECRFTYGFAFEADYSAFLDAVNNGALYELPFTVSIEGA